MKRTLPAILTLAVLAFSALSVSAQPAVADDNVDVNEQDDSGIGRVARLSFFDGDVSFQRAGVNEWSPVADNLPLLTGDQIYAGARARAEIQLGRGSYIRLSENTTLTISSLSEAGAQFEITEGTAIVRVERLSAAFQRFEVDTPNSALTLKGDGVYRINVTGGEVSEVIVRDGQADVLTDDGNFRVQSGYRLVVDTSPNGRLEIAADTSRDDWDRWSYDRDNSIDRSTVAISPDYVNSYETTSPDFYGVSDLSAYGTWTDSGSYGQCWVPRVGAGWAPYRQGQWLWIPSAGWTWLSSEPWGWAPYHYGRWTFVNGLGWAWVPGWNRGYPADRWDYRWRPAIVHFFHAPTSNGGQYVGWYPLTPGQRWHRPDWYDRHPGRPQTSNPLARGGARRNEDRRWTEPPPSARGTTVLPLDSFNRSGRSNVRPTAPTQEVSTWLNRDARPGLPEVRPAPIASSPVLDNTTGRRSGKIAIPPGDVLRRPVVSRTPITNSQQWAPVPARERRILQARQPEVITDEDVLRNRRLTRRESAGKDQNGSTNQQNNTANGLRDGASRIPKPQNSSGSENNSSSSERKWVREGRREGDQTPLVDNRSNGSSNSDRRLRRDGSSSTTVDGNGSQTSGDRDRRAREKTDSFPPSGGGTGNSSPDNNSTRSRQRDNSPVRSEPQQQKPPERTENREQVHEQRQQERREEREAQHEQKREERREERSNPKKP
jgi:uncharacterized protein DUF6600/FecR-like protein